MTKKNDILGNEMSYTARTEEELLLDDMRFLIIRLAKALKKSNPKHDLPDKATDFLKRKGLDKRFGSILRQSSEAD